MEMINAFVKTQHKNKCHMQFLTSAQNFKGGGGQLTSLTRPSRVPVAEMAE